MMEALSQRLNACQEKILELYELDSNELRDQIEHWKLIRHECVLLHRARQMGISCISHQVVPTLAVSRNKGHQAIELQLALEGLNKSAYNTEPWTLQATSYELWTTPPKQCFKKGGSVVEVRYDGDKNNAVQYTMWTCIYYCGEKGWCKVNGKVDYYGLFFFMDGDKQYYVNFEDDAKMYGKTGKYEVLACGQVINCPDSVSSTVDEVSTTETCERLRNTTTNSSCQHSQCTQENENPSSTSRKRTRESDIDPYVPRPLDISNTNVTGAAYPDRQWTNSDINTTPIVHLKGDANVLKCLRYRLENKFKNFYENISSTWHWASKNTESKHAIVTVTYVNEAQRQLFLNSVKLPTSVQVSTGVMSF